MTKSTIAALALIAGCIGMTTAAAQYLSNSHPDYRYEVREGTDLSHGRGTGRIDPPDVARKNRGRRDQFPKTAPMPDNQAVEVA